MRLGWIISEAAAPAITGGVILIALGLVEVVKAFAKRIFNGKNNDGKVTTVDCSRATEHHTMLKELGRILHQTDNDGALLVYSPKRELREILEAMREMTDELRIITSKLSEREIAQ